MRPWLTAACAVAASLLQGAAASRKAESADVVAFLTAGVREIAAPGVPGPLALAGEAVPVIAGRADRTRTLAAVVAAAPLGRGRIVAFGHTGYLAGETWETADTGRFLDNALAWAARRPSSAARALRIACQDKSVAEALQRRGYTAAFAIGGKESDALARADVLCVSQRDRSEAEAERLTSFVAEGGGALVAGLGWGWLQLNPGKELDRHPCSRLTSAAGIRWADGSLAATGGRGYLIGGDLTLCNADRALDAWEASLRAPKAAADWAQIETTLRIALRTQAAGSPTLGERARRLLAERGPAAVPTASKPVKAKDGPDRIAWVLERESASGDKAPEVRAHPAAREFPGLPASGARPVARETVLDGRRSGWHGVGLYAAAGEPVRIQVELDAARAGLKIRIGCHSDTLWHLDRWLRMPEVTRTWDLRSPEVEASSEFGGLVYVEVPETCPLERIDVRVEGAYAAPRFVLGATTAEAWRETERRAPAPWAELEGAEVILTVPANAAAALDDPGPLLTFWDGVARSMAAFAGRTRARRRPERFVADVQISAGYMHAGYPIMLPLEEVQNLITLENLKRGTWGLYHEIGHNHQEGDWTFEGTGEVTNNVLAMYVLDTICGVRPGTLWGGFDGIEDKVKAYRARGAPFEEWKADPAIALWTYVELQRGFGWEPFRRVFAEYTDLTPAQRPRSDSEKRDQWAVRFGRAVGRDLGPFFESWGIPVGAAARKALAGLPAWMPEAK